MKKDSLQMRTSGNPAGTVVVDLMRVAGEDNSTCYIVRWIQMDMGQGKIGSIASGRRTVTNEYSEGVNAGHDEGGKVESSRFYIHVARRQPPSVRIWQVFRMTLNDIECSTSSSWHLNRSPALGAGGVGDSGRGTGGGEGQRRWKGWEMLSQQGEDVERRSCTWRLHDCDSSGRGSGIDSGLDSVHRSEVVPYAYRVSTDRLLHRLSMGMGMYLLLIVRMEPPTLISVP
ncbi:hypothetical protein OH77DRAFT_537370 [Trametes cingulata]|nr:hypothetical protein OH77DRAFT_537370 [Trametes cingulata]